MAINLETQNVHHSLEHVSKEGYLQRYQPGLGHTYMVKYLALGTNPTNFDRELGKSIPELRIHKSKWQFRMYQSQHPTAFECTLT